MSCGQTERQARAGETFVGTALTDHWRDKLEFTLGIPFTDNNLIEALVNGDEIFPAMLDAIDDAKRQIDLLTYIYWSGNMAERFAEALSAQARKGRVVRVLLDSFGAQKMPGRLTDMMQEAGVEVRWFRPLATWRVWRNDKRTHRKVLVVDDEIGFAGGVGIADEWTGNANNPGEWRDTHFRLRGPCIRGLKAAFLDNWNEAGDWAWDAAHGQPQQAADGGVPIQVVRASSTIQWTDTATLLRVLIALCSRSALITTPYFVPDDKLVKLLCGTVARGIDIRLLIPGPYNDTPLPQLAGHVCIDQLLQAGVRIFRYQKTFIHTKSMVIDDAVSFVGSANMNHRSMGKDEECSAVVLSEAFAARMAGHFRRDVAEAEELELESWRKRGLWTKTKERLAHLLEEQL